MPDPDVEPLNESEDDASGCDHPADAIMWNAWNGGIQCHRCGGRVMELANKERRRMRAAR